jgi:hypothetical protein
MFTRRSKQRLPKTVRIEELRTDPDRVAVAARRKGGVRVVDAAGVERFTLWIPHTSLAE